ncbi:MAG: LysR family transcriptional regulator, partial [bacterium]|nr:LysR family transcriptional regulator [bacterium]
MAIAESGSFTRAAEQVGRTQSAVSMQMKKLELTLGQRLFIREARGVRLTRNGQGLITRARQILALLDQTAESLRTEPLEGNIRVGLPEEYGTKVLPSVLAHFAESHPAVRVTVQCEASPALDRAIAKGELDLAVVVNDSGQVEGEILVHDPTVWVTSASHAVHQQDPLPVAMYDHDCWWHDWALKTLDDRGRP